MIETGFTGEYTHNLDAKNRVSLPAQHKKYAEQIALAPENADKFVITKGKHTNLQVYTAEKWEKMVEGFGQSTSLINGNNPDDIRDRSRYTLPVSLDKSGRIMISGNLKAEANIKKEVVFIGVIDSVEIWDTHELEKYDKKRRQQNEPADGV